MIPSLDLSLIIIIIIIIDPQYPLKSQNKKLIKNNKIKPHKFRCISHGNMLDGRLPIHCLSTKEKVEKQEFNINCCKTDFCNSESLVPPPGIFKLIINSKNSMAMASQTYYFFIINLIERHFNLF